MTSQWPVASPATDQMSLIHAVTAPASLEGPEQLPVLMARGRSPVISGFPAESTSDYNHVREGELFSVFHFFFGFRLP